MQKDAKLIVPTTHDKPAYILYDGEGNQVSYNMMLNNLLNSNVILFGELHNNPICHWLQLELTRSLQENKSLSLGLEMIERDNQSSLNKYLEGDINQEQFDEEARLWNNYNTDYKPIIDFAKDNSIAVTASNVPRRYASKVYKGGFESLDTLTKEELSWIAPLPIEYDPKLPSYVKMLEMMGDHGGENLPKAQAIKDATMAHSILETFDNSKIYLHLHGSFHSDDYEGILWYLKQSKPELKYQTISSIEQSDIRILDEEHRGKADFIIAVPERMTKTY